jgi:hypothetical protein
MIDIRIAGHKDDIELRDAKSASFLYRQGKKRGLRDHGEMISM